MLSTAQRLTLTGLVLLVAAPPSLAQSPQDAKYEARLRDQERRIRALESSLQAPPSVQTKQGSSQQMEWSAGYNRGFVVRSHDQKNNPFELKINGRMQFRYSGFTTEKQTFENLGTAATGQPLRIEDWNNFEIERGRLVLSGTALDPNLHFFFNLDADTDDNHAVLFHDFWIRYDANDRLSLYVGKAKVPGSREWIEGSTTSQFADRSMATDFFRPNRSVGIWATGDVTDSIHYRLMIGNGFDATDTNFSQLNRDFAYSASAWFEPTGKFGRGYSDIKAAEPLRSRFGASLSYGEKGGTTLAGAALAEAMFLRLDDGTRLTALGVDRFDLTLLSVDAGIKCAGFSIHGEGYYRWIDSIGPTGAAPMMFPFTRNEAYGGSVMAGYMVVPERWELLAMSSTVQGDFKDTWEYGVGVNYFVNGTHNHKVTVDAINVGGSPVSNSSSNYRIGNDGTMFRIQYQVGF